MKTFILARYGETRPVGRTSVHAVLKSPYQDIEKTSCALMHFLRENGIKFSARQRSLRGQDITIFNFGKVDYEVREPLGSWEYLALHRKWFGIPEWELPRLESGEVVHDSEA